jgi:hypothetical protein
VPFPPPLPALGSRDDDDTDWVARGLSSSGDGSLVASTRRIAEFLAGVRRTKIEARRYKAGWARLSAGGRKRRATAPVVETRTGSQGHGVSLGVAGDSDGWGPDDRTSDAPPDAFQKVWVFLMPPVDRRGPVDGNDTVRIRSGRVIGVISRGSY